MTSPGTPTMRSPLSKQIKSAAFGIFATAAFLSSGTNAMAGTAEVNALIAALNGKTLAAATSEELYNAFKVVIANPKFAGKKGIVAGEALKGAGPNAPDAGEFFGLSLQSEPTLVPEAEINSFLALAAKTAGSGKNLDVTQIPDLAEPFLDDAAEATNTAILSKNKPGAGAILAGFAQDLTDDEKVAFANTAIANTKLKAAVQDIARYIGAEADDSADFAVRVASANPTNIKNSVKIATGVVAGDPTNAGEITDQLFDNAAVRPVLDKGIATYAKFVGAAADIEQIVKVAFVIGEEIRTGTVKLSKAASLTKALTFAVANKPPRTDKINPISENRFANKADEIVEVAAGLLGGVISTLNTQNGSNELTDKTAPKTVVAILKAAVTAGKVAVAKFSGITDKAAKNALIAKIAADTAGSLVITIEDSNLSDALKTAIKTVLLNPKTTKSFGAGTLAAITLAYSDNEDGKDQFENGNTLFGDATDPETDAHAFL